MKQITWSALGWMAMLISTSPYANDSIARVGTGGLELLKTDHIQVISEILEISTSKIRVKYHFLNTSNNDIKTTVAFPMPAFDETRAMGRENQRPLDSFQIFVNGALIPGHKTRVFLINNIDVTDKFRKIGLSENKIFDPNFSCLGDINDNANADCKLTTEQNTAIKKMHTGGNWQIKETAYWEQTFPAGKEIEVVHEYKPFVGVRLDYMSIINLDIPGEASADVCLDDKTLRAIKDKVGIANNRGDSRVLLQEVEYILGTGRNWKGPIKNFKLIIKKESPDDVVSLCFPGNPSKTSPTTIEFSQSNFAPQDKLIVFFYHIGPRF
jgi:hypothetical protein